MSLSAAILDLDGLVLDTERVARRAWQSAAAEFGYTIDDQLYEAIIGHTPEGTGDILTRALGDAFPFHEALLRQQTLMNGLMDQKGLDRKPGVEQMLHTLEELGLPVAVATSAHRASAHRKLAAANMRDVFHTIVCGDDVDEGKPAPDIFLAAAQELDVPAARCVVLEDSDPGVLGAHAAGMRVILVPDLKAPSPEARALAWHVCESLTAAAATLRSLEMNGRAQPPQSGDADSSSPGTRPTAYAGTNSG
jgi:HAD superfamily hydrolase (TIGR01509 family)